MTARGDFTDEEWFRVRSAPWQVAMGVIEVDPSGTFAAGRELRAVEDELRRAQEDAAATDLVRLVARAVADEGDPDTGTAPADDADTTAEALPDRVLEAMGTLGELLEAKVEAADAAAYRAWLVGVASIAAAAAKEGVAGLTGPTVSAAEQAYLDRLRDVLAPPGAWAPSSA